MKSAIVYKLKNVSAAFELSKIKYICPMTGTKARSPHGKEPNVAAMNNPPPYMTVPRRVRTTATTVSEMARKFIPGQISKSAPDLDIDPASQGLHKGLGSPLPLAPMLVAPSEGFKGLASALAAT
jgi:hypothetical protein